MIQAKWQQVHDQMEELKEAYLANPTPEAKAALDEALAAYEAFGQVNQPEPQAPDPQSVRLQSLYNEMNRLKLEFRRQQTPESKAAFLEAYEKFRLAREAFDGRFGDFDPQFLTGGPDGFGYTFTDSTEIGGPVFSFVDISGSGTLVAVGDDTSSNNSGISAPVTLGAPFNFYGVVQTMAVPATNGYISLGSVDDTGPDLSNDCPIPASPSTGGSGPLGRIYPLHDDLVAGGLFGFPTGGIFYQFFPVCPHPHPGGGCSVFHYNDANHFAGAGPFDYEAILFDNGDIIFQYGPGNTELGSGSTTGIQDYDPDGPGPTAPPTALQYGSCNTLGSLSDNLAVLIFFRRTFADDSNGNCVIFDINGGYTWNGPGGPFTGMATVTTSPDGRVTNVTSAAGAVPFLRGGVSEARGRANFTLFPGGIFDQNPLTITDSDINDGAPCP